MCIRRSNSEGDLTCKETNQIFVSNSLLKLKKMRQLSQINQQKYHSKLLRRRTKPKSSFLKGKSYNNWFYLTFAQDKCNSQQIAIDNCTQNESVYSNI